MKPPPVSKHLTIPEEDPAFDDHNRCCGIPIIAAGHCICGLVFFEGFVVLMHCLDVVWPGVFYGLTWQHNPMMELHMVFLWCWALGDMLMAALGSLGIWFGRNVLPASWKHLSRMHAFIATVLVGSLIAWRFLVTIGLAPFVGVMSAFAPPAYSKEVAFLVTFLYVMISIYLIWTLLLVFHEVVSQAQFLQQHINDYSAEERVQLLHHAHAQGHHSDGEGLHDHEFEPFLFGCVPLADAVALYAFIILSTGALCAMMLLLYLRGTIGGWAWVGAPWGGDTHWLELFVYTISLVGGIFGFYSAWQLAYSEVPHKRARGFLFIFVLLSLLRFALLIPITGMTLINEDFCGFYRNWLASISIRPAALVGGGDIMHCQPVEYLRIIACVVMCLLDAYLIWGAYQLWYHCRILEEVYGLGEPLPRVALPGTAMYGSAEAAKLHYNTEAVPHSGFVPHSGLVPHSQSIGTGGLHHYGAHSMPPPLPQSGPVSTFR